MEIVDCLFRLSISIRNAPPHDRFKEAHLINTSHFKASDIGHARDMFPLAPKPLTELIGKAISRRRQFFKYRALHHRKLASGIDNLGGVEGAEASTIASSVPGDMRSGSPGPENADSEVLNEDGASQSGWTDTTYGHSADGGLHSKIPPLPKEAGERPFECSFCFTVIFATTTKAWM
jgi:hypothetical protein